MIAQQKEKITTIHKDAKDLKNLKEDKCRVIIALRAMIQGQKEHGRMLEAEQEREGNILNIVNSMLKEQSEKIEEKL